MFRYPGGKSRLYKQLEPFLLERLDTRLIIPFVGAGHETIRLIKKKSPQFIWLNDLDYGICSFWKAVYFYPKKFISKIKKYNPKVADFYSFKEYLNSIERVPSGVEEVTDTALIKLAIHQISYSGLGVMAGGPIGGEKQNSSYTVDCRWNPDKIIQSILNTYNDLKKSEVRVTCLDFADVLDHNKNKGLIYLDPPYYEQGKSLYKHGFCGNDHWRLSESLYNREDWVLSYDDHPTIRSLYSFAQIYEVGATYTINSARRKQELIIVG